MRMIELDWSSGLCTSVKGQSPSSDCFALLHIRVRSPSSDCMVRIIAWPSKSIGTLSFSPWCKGENWWVVTSDHATLSQSRTMYSSFLNMAQIRRERLVYADCNYCTLANLRASLIVELTVCSKRIHVTKKKSKWRVDLLLVLRYLCTTIKIIF